VNFSNRIYQIDLFRFIAALMVVLYHYLFVSQSIKGLTNVRFNEVGTFFKYGYLGVDLFFIISGFVIMLSVKHRSLKKFMISRFLRLYPIYWMCILITFLVTLFLGSPKFQSSFQELLVNTTMFQGVFGVKSIDGVYWSLLVELKFYMLIAIYLIVNNFKKISLNYLLFLWLLITVLHLFFREAFVFKVLNYFFVLEWSSYFIAGIVFFQIFKNRLNFSKAFLLIVCLSISIYNAVLRIESLESAYDSLFSPYVIACILSIFYLLMVLVSTGKLRSLNSPKLLKMGLLTYPLYLLHQYVGYVLFDALEPYINKYLILGFTVGLMILLSYVISAKLDPLLGGFLRQKFKFLQRDTRI
jgi:peptidoglycan/LPS O-acetylase OafA/YrhL